MASKTPLKIAGTAAPKLAHSMSFPPSLTPSHMMDPTAGLSASFSELSVHLVTTRFSLSNACSRPVALLHPLAPQIQSPSLISIFTDSNSLIHTPHKPATTSQPLVAASTTLLPFSLPPSPPAYFSAPAGIGHSQPTFLFATATP
jgi:hypothetical protein